VFGDDGYIWRFDVDRKPRIELAIKAFGTHAKVFRLSGLQDVEDFLNEWK
jgi:hypothetical protein